MTATITGKCTCSHKRNLAQSDRIIVSKCADCDTYWLTMDDCSWVCPYPTIFLCEIIEAQQRFVPKDADDTKQTSQRETEALVGIAEGLTYQQVAERMVVEPRTVENYLYRYMKRHDLHSRTEAIRHLKQVKAVTS